MTQYVKNIPLTIAGASYVSRSRPLASQQTKNFYSQVTKQGRDEFVLHSFPGLKEFGNIGSAAKDRGITRMGETGYRVADQTLYSFDSSGTHTSIGTIPGTERCTFANDGVNLAITNGSGKVYVYDGSTISQVTDTDIDGAKAVTFINNQFVYTKDQLFIVSNVGDPTAANSLNAANAESKPDDIVRAYAFQQSLYLIGKETVEPWWNSGQGNPPFERIDGQISEVGCSALHSVAHTDEALYWLGDDNAVYQASGGTRNRISTAAISNAISGYSKISDAVAYTFTFQGNNFYTITFPEADKTWCYNETLGPDVGWFELSSGTSGGRYQARSLVRVFNKNILADETNGKLYELDKETYTNNGDTIQRVRTTGVIDGSVLNAPGARVQMSRLELIMETGIGLVSGQGDDPQVMFELSFDGGKSWKEKGWVKVGRLGDNMRRVEMFTLDTFYSMMIRITTSDPVPYSIYSAAIDLRLAGR